MRNVEPYLIGWRISLFFHERLCLCWSLQVFNCTSRDKAGRRNLIVCGCYAFPLYRSLYWIQFSDLVPQERESRVAQNKDLVADAQTLLEENLSEKKSVESARRLRKVRTEKLHLRILFLLPSRRHIFWDLAYPDSLSILSFSILQRFVISQEMLCHRIIIISQWISEYRLEILMNDLQEINRKNDLFSYQDWKTTIYNFIIFYIIHGEKK